MILWRTDYFTQLENRSYTQTDLHATLKLLCINAHNSLNPKCYVKCNTMSRMFIFFVSSSFFKFFDEKHSQDPFMRQ